MLQRIVWIGRKEYERRMGEATKKVRKEMKNRVREAAKILARGTRSRISSMGLVKTGTLRKSIGFRVKQYRDGGIYAVVKPMVKGKRRGYHGHLVEFGTEARYTASGAYRGVMAERPFLRREVDANREKFFDLIGKTFEVV